MGSAFHIDTGQVTGIIGDDVCEAHRLIGVVLHIHRTLVHLAGLREKLQAGQLRELLVVCLGLDVGQLLCEEDASVIRRIQTQARERVPEGPADQQALDDAGADQGCALGLQRSAVFLTVTVVGVVCVKLCHIPYPPYTCGTS